MKQKKWRNSLLLFVAAVLLATFLYTLLFHFDNKYTIRASVSQDGQIKLSENELENASYLADGWELYPDQLLTPEGLAAKHIPPVGTFAGEYLNLSGFHDDRSPYGNATWRLPIRYDGDPVNVSLVLPEIFCAFRLYVNGEELAAQGSLDPYAPLVRDTTVSFLLLPETEILIQTANYTHYYGGLTYPPVLGTAQSIAAHTGMRLLFYGALCFGTLAAALFSIAHWLGARQDRDPAALLSGILALSFAVWVSYPFTRLLGISSIRVFYALEDAASLLVIWCALHIALRLGRISRTRGAQLCSRFAFAMVLVGTIVPLFVLPVLPAYTLIYGKLITGYRLISAITLTGVSFYGRLQDKAAGSFMLFGSAFYAAGLFYGVRTVTSFEPAQFGWMEEYGALALVFCFEILMVRRSYAMLRENIRLNEHLQEEVQEKTRALGSLVKERENLMSGFLHDMKSPAAFITSYVQMVRHNNVRLDDDTRRQLAVIEEKCDALSDRVRQVQQFAAENPLITPLESLDLCAFLRDFYRFNKPDVEMDGQNFNLRLPKGSCLILADPDKLNRMLQNLIYNAVSFTPEGGHITLSLTWDDERAILSLKDTGCGIAPEILPDIFNQFFTSRSDDGGTGMGLYLVRNIVREHGGEVTVRSRIGEGTCFTVRLPLV